MNHQSYALSARLSLLMAVACGLIVANIYYAQPLIGPISASLSLSPGAAGLIVTMSQIGYGLGLLLIVPLGDLFENKKLVLLSVGLCAAALIGAATANSAASFLISALFIGLGSVAVQMLIPFASHLAQPGQAGRVIGNLLGGLMFGIMLARPVSGIVTQLGSWHTIFYLSAACMVVLFVLLYRALPVRQPESTLSYGGLISSMLRMMVTVPVLRRRALYHACLFGTFSLFWTTIPLLLASPLFHLDQAGIALFALAGVAGAIAGPIAGRVADKGWIRPATGMAMAAVAIAFLLTRLVDTGTTAELSLLTFAAILLDFGVAANLTLGQRALFSLKPEFRSRLNGMYMSTFFVGGALGSGVGAWSFSHGGWSLTAWIGFSLPAVALLYFMTERK
jgi:predicted MFS family arabinose efflux permease